MAKISLLSVFLAVFDISWTLGLPKGQNELRLCSSKSQYFSRFTGNCQPCAVCPWETLVECGPNNNAICASENTKTTKNPTQRIKETVLNSSQSKREFLRQLRLEHLSQMAEDRGGRRRSRLGNAEEIDGQVKVKTH